MTHVPATTIPTSAPPIASSANMPKAFAGLNRPVIAAATAKRKSTRLVASLNKLSPSSRIRRRRGSFTRCSTSRVETASGGATSAPSAAQAAHGNDGISQWATIATTAVVKTTAPIANALIPSICRRKCLNEIPQALSISSGGRTIASTNSGFKFKFWLGKLGKKAMAAPPIINDADGGNLNFCPTKWRAITANKSAIMNSKTAIAIPGSHKSTWLILRLDQKCVSDVISRYRCWPDDPS